MLLPPRPTCFYPSVRHSRRKSSPPENLPFDFSRLRIEISALVDVTRFSRFYTPPPPLQVSSPSWRGKRWDKDAIRAIRIVEYDRRIILEKS